jgi:hypothetical protein
MRRGSAAKFHSARVAWVQAHPDLVAGVPTLAEDVTEDNRPCLAAVEAAMLAAGLFGPTGARSAPRPVRRETIRRLVGELRHGRTGGAQW